MEISNKSIVSSPKSSSSSTDVLKELNEQDCLVYLEILKKHQPEHIYSHHHLFNHIRYLRKIKEIQRKNHNIEVRKNDDYDIDDDTFDTAEISDRCRTKVFGYRYGKLENCTIIGMSGLKDYWLQLFTLDETGEELFKCLKETNLIDWNIRPLSGIMQAKFSNEIDQIFKFKNLIVKNYHHDTVVCVTKEKLKDVDISVSNDVYLGLLQIYHAQLINEKWPHKYPDSLKYIESCINLNNGTGLFKTDTNELIAWDLTSENFTSGFLYTMESERRKGYGKIVCAAECKRISETYNIDMYGFVLQGNIASERLVQEIGFIPVNKLDWFEQKE